MSELWERELDDKSGDEYECCNDCGDFIYNGEFYFEIDGVKLCENCMNDRYRRCMDYDDAYTLQDYLCEKYERERCDE